VRRATNETRNDIIKEIFLSTLSVRRATCNAHHASRLLCISIHALREESDVHKYYQANHLQQFLSTLSVRRATGDVLRLRRADLISIHALREESDVNIAPHRVIFLISIHALREESDSGHYFAK